MRSKGIGLVATAVAGIVLMAGVARAGTDGLVLTALGIYKGKEDISAQQIQCEIPTVASAIPSAVTQAGLWNTYGAPTLFFPDRNNPFGDPCGGWLQVRNNLFAEGMNVSKVTVKLRIPGANRFRDFVPTRNGFPTACKQFRKSTLFAGTWLDGELNQNPNSESGLTNVAFIQLLPIVSTDLIHCLRAQYAPLTTDEFVSLPLVAAITATGRAINGDRFTSNVVSYTITLRHTCGNGRVDDGEQCDATSVANTCAVGPCTGGHCTGLSSITCTTDADCVGSCVAPANPEECTCLF